MWCLAILSDGVIAPLFWLMLLGTPGMLAYKMVNTLDSMIAYHTERYLQFGCVAAHIDDVANYIPARLTALLMKTAIRVNRIAEILMVTLLLAVTLLRTMLLPEL